jgi:6-phosphogluconolactonase
VNLVEYPDRELMMITLADRIAAELRAELRHEDRATLAVPGGTTPGPIFDVLAGVNLGWDRIDLMLTDERWVPESSDRSNTRLLRRRLMTGAAGAARYYPLYAATETPEAALDGLAEAIAPTLPISVLLLGMGADMHCASLFPGADRLDQALAPDAPVLMAMRAPGLDEPRVTLTARVLKAAINIHLLITGSEKRAALEKARGLGPAEAPVAAVLGPATVHWAE